MFLQQAFVTCSYVVMYIRSVSLYTALRVFCTGEMGGVPPPAKNLLIPSHLEKFSPYKSFIPHHQG